MAISDSLPLIADAIAGTLIRGQLKPPTPKGWLTPPLNPLWRGKLHPPAPPSGRQLPLFFHEERELNDSLHEVLRMEKDDLMRIVRGKDWVENGSFY